jgi:uncharacterized protein YecE (DUF72 family)
MRRGAENSIPEGLRQKDELAYAARKFPSIEINGTFYSLQQPESFATWHDVTPEARCLCLFRQ